MARKTTKKTATKKSAVSFQDIQDMNQEGKIEAAMAKYEAPAPKKKSTPKPKPAPKPKPTPRILRRGMQGDDVKKMQKAIGVSADGDFGFDTLVALKKWQNVNGLKADGIVGPVTQAKIYG